MRRPFLALALLAVLSTGCSKKTDDAKPVATAAVTLSPSAAAIDAPVVVSYKFVVAADAPPFKQDYYVFVHFNDATGDQLWTDDHLPPTPTSRWKPGSTIEYMRTMFVPKLAYTGRTTIDLGVYSPQTNERLPLGGQSVGQRAYRVGTLDVKPQTGSTIVTFRNGWHDAEFAQDSPGVEWHWSKGDATLAFRNPKRDTALLLDVDQPVMELTPPQRVEVRAGATVIDSFTLQPGRRELKRIALTAAQLGAGDDVELTVAVDRTFSPAYLAGSKSGDSRTLGIRVFHAYLQPN
jgi:hypothetical protein